MKFDLEKLAMLGALGLAAYWLTSKTASATSATKNAAPLIWAQNPTAANPQTSSTGANVATAGLNLLTSLFGSKSTAAYTPTYTGWATPDYGFSTAMLGTSSPTSQADLYAINPPASYYGQGFDLGVTEGGFWDTTP